MPVIGEKYLLLSRNTVMTMFAKICSVRILFANVTHPYMSHILCVVTCLLQNKAYCKTHCWSWFKGWSAVFSPLERYSWRALYRSCNSCIEEDNSDCKLQALTDLSLREAQLRSELRDGPLENLWGGGGGGRAKLWQDFINELKPNRIFEVLDVLGV